MTTEQTIAFMLFAIVAAISPGPSNIILTSTGAAVGVLGGLPCLLGVAVGMGTMMFLVAFGLGNLVLESPVLLHVFKWAGVAYLLWLAWKMSTAGRSDATSKQEFVGFLSAAAFQWVNPKSWLVSVSAVGTYLETEAGSPFKQSLSFGMLFAVAALPSCFVWLAFGAAVQRLLQTKRALKIFNVAMGALLVGSILSFAW